MLCDGNNGGGGGGFTLVELMVVVVIISIMSVSIVAEMHGTFQDALLRSTSRELANACNAASSRAIAINRPFRVLLDNVDHRYVLERSTRAAVDFHPAPEIPGGTGKLDPRISIHVLVPGMNAPDDAGDEPTANSANPDDSALSGAADAVTFYPDGTADEREIELADRDGFRLALRINPITSRVKIAPLARP